MHRCFPSLSEKREKNLSLFIKKEIVYINWILNDPNLL